MSSCLDKQHQHNTTQQRPLLVVVVLPSRLFIFVPALPCVRLPATSSPPSIIMNDDDVDVYGDISFHAPSEHHTLSYVEVCSTSKHIKAHRSTSQHITALNALPILLAHPACSPCLPILLSHAMLSSCSPHALLPYSHHALLPCSCLQICTAW